MSSADYPLSFAFLKATASILNFVNCTVSKIVLSS